MCWEERKIIFFPVRWLKFAKLIRHCVAILAFTVVMFRASNKRQNRMRKVLRLVWFVCVCVCLRVAEKLSPTNTGGPIFGQFQTFTSIEVNDLSLGHSFQSTACVREYNTAKRVFKAPSQARPKACLCVFVYVVRPVRGFPNVSLARCSWANEELRT